MKTFLTIVATALVTWFVCSVTSAVKINVERLWFISAVKAPGRMAFDEIQNDFSQGRDAMAKAKFELFRTEWARFNLETNFHGEAIGSIMVKFGKLERANSGNPP
ncbi:MAG: hypothetical protein RL380_126 [Verrucomicrobiota bacterium]